MDKKVVDDWDKLSEYRWRLGDVWTAPADGNPDPDVDSIMRIIFGDEYKA